MAGPDGTVILNEPVEPPPHPLPSERVQRLGRLGLFGRSLRDDAQSFRGDPNQHGNEYADCNRRRRSDRDTNSDCYEHARSRPWR